MFRQEVAVLARAGAAAAAATACSSLQKLSSTGQLKVHAAADRARHRGGQTLTSPAPDRSADLAADRQAAVSRPHIRGASHRLRRSGPVRCSGVRAPGLSGTRQTTRGELR